MKFILNILLFLITHSVNSQTIEIKLHKIGKLTQLDQSLSNQVHIQNTTIIDSQAIYFYLINQTDDSIIIELCAEENFDQICFNLEGFDIDEEWKSLDWPTYGLDYTTRMKFITKLPPYHYTWKKFSIANLNDGVFKTLARVKIELNDSTIYSPPLKVNIDFFRFHPKMYKDFKVETEYIEKRNIEPDNELNLCYGKLLINRKYRNYTESVKIANFILDRYPNEYRAKWLLASSLSNYLVTKNIAINSDEHQLISYKICQLLKDFPIEHENYKRSKKLISYYIGTFEKYKNISKLLKKECVLDLQSNTFKCLINNNSNKLIIINPEK